MMCQVRGQVIGQVMSQVICQVTGNVIYNHMTLIVAAMSRERLIWDCICKAPFENVTQ